MPIPLSETWMSRFPPARISTRIEVLSASTAFSISSLTTDAGRSTTSPAAILLATSAESILIFSHVFKYWVSARFFPLSKTGFRLNLPPFGRICVSLPFATTAKVSAPINFSTTLDEIDQQHLHRLTVSYATKAQETNNLCYRKMSKLYPIYCASWYK